MTKKIYNVTLEYTYTFETQVSADSEADAVSQAKDEAADLFGPQIYELALDYDSAEVLDDDEEEEDADEHDLEEEEEYIEDEDEDLAESGIRPLGDLLTQTND